MPSWVKNILDSTEELESPRIFWYWSALSAISAVVKDNVWLPRGFAQNKIFPNIFVMLNAISGLRKGPPIAMMKDLVQRTDVTRIITGRASIQGILKALSQQETIKGGAMRWGGKPVAYIVSSELTSSLVEDREQLRF